MLKLKRAGFFTKIVIVILLIYASVTLINLCAKIADARQTHEELAQQVAEVEVENDELRYAIENSDQDSVIADIARDKLGLVLDGEKVYYGS